MFDSICVSEQSDLQRSVEVSSRQTFLPMNLLSYPESTSNLTIAGPKYMASNIRGILHKIDSRLQAKHIDVTVNNRLARIREPVQARFDRLHEMKVNYGNFLTNESYEKWQKRLTQQQSGIYAMFPGSARDSSIEIRI